MTDINRESEKKYLICEYGTWPNVEPITETELRNRWNAAHVAMEKSDTPWQAALSVLLYGEGEKGDEHG